MSNGRILRLGNDLLQNYFIFTKYWLERYKLLWGRIIVKLLALALTNLVLSLVNLVTNLAKPSLGQPSY